MALLSSVFTSVFLLIIIMNTSIVRGLFGYPATLRRIRVSNAINGITGVLPSGVSSKGVSVRHRSYLKRGGDVLGIIRGKEAAAEQEHFGSHMNRMISAVKANNLNAARDVYEQFVKPIKLEPGSRIPLIINLYLSGFQTKDHLSSLVELINHLRSRNIRLSEIAYLALIRCHCDADEIQIAWRYLLEMDAIGFENRVRVFQPFFEAYERNIAVEQQLELVAYMRDHKLEVRSEQAETILRTYSVLRHRAPQRAATLYPAIRAFLHSITDHIQGIPGDQLTIISSLINQCSDKETEELGLLIDRVEEVEGAMISNHHLSIDGSVLAYNISFEPTMLKSNVWAHEPIPIPRSADPYLPDSMRDCDRLEFFPERFIVKTAREACLTKNLENDLNQESITSNSDGNGGSNDADGGNGSSNCIDGHEKSHHHNHNHVNKDRWLWEKNLDARQVSIPASSSQCPHCNENVNNIPMRASEKEELRSALYNVASKMHPKGVEYLQEFETFLQQEKEFEYIVDGANVAYNNQNYGYGRFSYGQIRLVLEELQRIGKRVLVILPSIYSVNATIIPNRVKGSSARSLPLKANEIQFLQGLHAKNLLYTVPRGMNDDLFWMMATVYHGRKQGCFVVTNDLMRDHAISTLATTAFARLRTSTLVYFSIFRPDGSQPRTMKEGNTTSLPNNISTATSTNSSNSNNNNNSGSVYIDTSVEAEETVEVEPEKVGLSAAELTTTDHNDSDDGVDNSDDQSAAVVASSSRLSAENLAQHNRLIREPITTHANSNPHNTSKSSNHTTSTSVAHRVITNQYVTFLDDDMIQEEVQLLNQQYRAHSSRIATQQQLEDQELQEYISLENNTHHHNSHYGNNSSGNSSSNNQHEVDSEEEEEDRQSSLATDESDYGGSNVQASMLTGNFGGTILSSTQQNRHAKNSKNNSSSSSATPNVYSSDDQSNHAMLPPVLVAERKELLKRANIVQEMVSDKKKYYQVIKIDDFVVPGTVTFYKPGNYSRDIQEASSSNNNTGGVQRWHIPATDKMKWLCVKFAP